MTRVGVNVMYDKIYLNDDWLFTEEYLDSLLEQKEEDHSLEHVRIPHTCVETTFNYFDEDCYQMICGYQKKINVPLAWKGKQILLTFEGAAHVAEVFINGKKVVEHRCGYTSFTINISGRLRFDADNTITVKLNTREDSNIPPFGYVVDYMTYGGIYRDVYLEVKHDVFLDDVFVKTNILKPEDALENTAWINADAMLISEITLNRQSKNMYIRQSMNGVILGEVKIISEKIMIEYTVCQVKIWDINHPFLYKVKTELLEDGKVVDEKISKVGFRRAQFLKDGFYLNGRKLRLRGLNRHQSYPYVGYAMPESAQKSDADILKKELGLNAVRTSHYPQSHYFLDQCDAIGLLVFTEIPGWQYIGNEAWKEQAIANTEEMVKQYRNHTSIILWGVRINESLDDDDFYKRTNEVAHSLDDSRPTGGVRAHKKSSLLEDVYTYNDFLHDGNAKGCDRKKDVTSDINKAYLISEYNGHMYPTKNYDCEEHRMHHAIRHAVVLDEVASQRDIAGSFGWCMFDYNTHKDFGSGDRICYHGVMDMFRNPKMASAIYASQADNDDILEVSTSMDIGEHPGCNRGAVYIFTNADSVRMYKNDLFIKEFYAKDSPFKYLKHGPILIDDFIGKQIENNEKYSQKQAQQISLVLNTVARQGLRDLPMSIKWIAMKMVLLYHMKPQEAVALYNKYIGDWGGSVTSYLFEAVKKGRVVKTIRKEPMKKLHLYVVADKTDLKEENTYDVASIRIQARDENDNILNYYQEPVYLEIEGPLEIIGPHIFALQGGMAGTYVKTIGKTGKGSLKLRTSNAPEVILTFVICVNGIIE